MGVSVCLCVGDVWVLVCEWCGCECECGCVFVSVCVGGCVGVCV